MAESVVAAVVQLCSGDNLQHNLERCAELCRRAARAGAELVVLPENFAYIRNLERKLALAEPLSAEQPGPILAAMQAVARELGIHLLLGGTPVVGPDPEHFYQSAVLLDPEGRIVAAYRKMHLFDVNIPDGAVFTESRWIAPGDELVTAPAPGGTLGFSICYDLRFPELYRALTARGANLVCVPAAFTLHTGKDHWMPLLRARAIENQLFVLAADQWGHHRPGRASFGKSCIIDPWGTVLAMVHEGEGVAVAELDLAQQRKVRRELPCLEHRRLGLRE